MIYLVEPTKIFDLNDRKPCRTDICGRLSIEPICPPVIICPIY